MKISVGTLFGSFKRSSSSFSSSSSKKKKKSRSASSAGSQSDGSVSACLQSTPRSVLPSAAGEAWSSPSSSSGHSPAFSVYDLFAVFDRDGDGKITPEELSEVLRRLGPRPPTAEEVAAMVAEADRDGDGCITLEELGAALGPAPAALAGPGDGGGELRDAFAVFDADGDGKISAEELLGVFVALGDDCTLDDCRRMILGVDSDGDGLVCFEDFARMMDGQR